MSTPSGESASPCLLETFPVEILEQIYLYSENPSFALVTKQISQCLSSEFVRLQFCVPLFSGERAAWGPGKTPKTRYSRILGRTHTLVLQQPWFSKGFARKVQYEVMRLRKVQQGTVDSPMSQPDRPMHHPSRLVRTEFLDQIPRDLLLEGPWVAGKSKLIRGLLNWGAPIPSTPEDIAPTAMRYAIIGHAYGAVKLLHNCGKVRFDHSHFLAAVQHQCSRRIVEMIVESNNNQPTPFIDPFDKRIYNRAMYLEWAGDPMGRQILNDVLWKGNERELTVATKRL